MKAKHDKYHLLVSVRNVTMNASGVKIKTLNARSYSELKSTADSGLKTI